MKRQAQSAQKQWQDSDLDTETSSDSRAQETVSQGVLGGQHNLVCCCVRRVVDCAAFQINNAKITLSSRHVQNFFFSLLTSENTVKVLYTDC